MSVKTPSKIGTTRASSHPDWLRVSSAIGTMVNTWAGRYDVAAFAAPGAGNGHPAFFNPATCEVEVNVERCFGAFVEPSELATLDTRSTQYEWPRATGTIFHEALHARFSQWDLVAAQRDLTPAEFKALVLLEESRIEANGLKLFPRNAAFLRTMALEIVMSDMDEIYASSAVVTAANVAALTLARVDAGSLLSEDVEVLSDIVTEKLGADVVAKLTDIWRAAQAHPLHDNPADLYTLAREWVAVITEAAHEAGEPGPGEPAPGEGAGEGAGVGGALGEFMEAVKGALEDAAATTAIEAYGDLVDAETADDWEQAVKSKDSESRAKRDAQSTAAQVFGKGTTEIHDSGSFSELRSKRQPTGDERAAAVKIANMLDRAKYRDRDATEVTSIVPPGRLRTRAAVQGAALKSKGIMTQTEPWRHTVRKHTDDPTLSIGVMVDISGSMAEAMEPMAVAAWVLSEAVRRVQGKAAMVYYGNDAFPTLKPGQHLSEVRVWSASDSTEKFDRGFKAVNGALNLTWGTGARMLVVVSDGCYTGPEKQAAKAALAQCKQAGVGVLWLGFGSGYLEATDICRGTDAVIVRITGSTVAAAGEIGAAAARALAGAAAS